MACNRITTDVEDKALRACVSFTRQRGVELENLSISGVFRAGIGDAEKELKRGRHRATRAARGTTKVLNLENGL